MLCEHRQIQAAKHIDDKGNREERMILKDRAREMLPFAIRNVPRLSVSKQVQRPETYDPAAEHWFRYKAKNHPNLPHVVKFSGGRSSAMLLFVLLENGLLDRDRGDVIVFNNTSSEHPYTYVFVQHCMQVARRYGIPFFQVEFQTYEDARRGEWTRLPTYRLVNNEPKSPENPDGFHWRGELFEELVSWKGYVPNKFNRICTQHLKLDATRGFLKDWLSSRPTIPRLGHYGDGPRIDPETAFRRHLENQGGVPKDIYLQKRSYVWRRPHSRPKQQYGDFCPDWHPFVNKVLTGKTFGDKAWFGRGGVEYVALIGLRGDEPHRIQRVEGRNESTAGYEGEHVCMPLHDMAVTRNDVNAFWDSQDWDLLLPKDANLSNCVFCFLKGVGKLRDVRARMGEVKQTSITGFGALEGTPCDLDWWSHMESKYGRDLHAEGRPIRAGATRIGFFGSDPSTYDDLEAGRDTNELIDTMLPCDCTE